MHKWSHATTYLNLKKNSKNKPAESSVSIWAYLDLLKPSSACVMQWQTFPSNISELEGLNQWNWAEWEWHFGALIFLIFLYILHRRSRRVLLVYYGRYRNLHLIQNIMCRGRSLIVRETEKSQQQFSYCRFLLINEEWVVPFASATDSQGSLVGIVNYKLLPASQA